MNKASSLALFILRRIRIGIRILFKFLFLLPVPLFMVWFSYNVDVSGLFQGELAPREVASMLLDGQTVSNYDMMDERKILELYVQNLPEDQVPDTLALGSSRVMQLNSDIVGSESFFNGGMSGAGLMDIINNWYLFERAEKLPKNLILCVDPWLFNGVSTENLNRRADANLFAEFQEKALGIDSNFEEPDTVALWKALIDPSYFQGNVRYYLSQKKGESPTNEDGEAIPFYPVTGDISQLDYAIKFPDGSMQYPAKFRTMNYDETMQEVLTQAGTMQALHGFPELDPYWTDIFQQFIQHVQDQGVHVVFLLTPYHPFICLHVQHNPENLDGFFQVEPWLREYAAAQNIPLYGSYHPGRVGVPESLFFDGLHCRGEALQLMFPGIDAALEGQRTNYETQYLEKYGDTMNSRNALIGTDPDCVVVDTDWFAEASA